jgi:hypothetical protein
MIAGVIKRVFARPFYSLLAMFIATLTLSVLLLLPNQAVLLDILSSPIVSLSAKLSFMFSLYGSLGTNFTLFSATYTVLIAVLLGVNVSLLWYYAARARALSKADRSLTFTGIGGFVSGLFGIGCAACGTILFAGLLKLLGITWLITYLPLHGAEFGVIGVLLLIVSSYSLAKRIDDPLVCTVD